ncbi:MAG: alpha/beta hydrolase [Blastocatellia bacterium]
MKSIAITICLLCALAGVAAAQKVIRLYPGPAPGSENWTQQEKESFSQAFNTQLVMNVTQPTLTAYLPDPATASGTAVIIAPGGGFHFLSINSEGVEVAKWLAARGVAAFVLKYRLVRTGEDAMQQIRATLSDMKKFEEVTAPVIPLAVADGMAAISYVRKHAAEFGVSPQRVGIMGFSAGGTITAAIVLQSNADNRPDFAAPIYAWVEPVKAPNVPADAPPLFLAAATDDGLAPDSVKLYSQWIAAKKSAELHLYSKGGHGFGMRKQNLPSDQWIERFGEWLAVQGLMKK